MKLRVGRPPAGEAVRPLAQTSSKLSGSVSAIWTSLITMYSP
jgi:hypothetical protein